MPERGTADRVCILMGIYNGAENLGAQLQSFADQSHGGWDLIVGDDGSSDAGPDIVRDFAVRMAPHGNRVTLVGGPQDGLVANFLGLIGRTPEAANWLAFSDQDDVWLPERLSRGIAALQALPADIPALYCSATLVVDKDLGRPRLSRVFLRPPGFRNALLQNIAAGNTILLNAAAARLARAAAPGAAVVSGLVAHDWWLYQLITGAGGRVFYDPVPTLYYRQHGRNQVGANQGLRAGLTRLGMLLQGQVGHWNAANIAALHAAAPWLTAENRALVEDFAALRARSVLPRLRDFAMLRLYRQSRLGQYAMWLAVVLGRI